MEQKRLAIINDITGFGRCSVAVMAPIISAMKIQAVAIPTAILSAHTQFPEYYFDDYTPRMPDYIQSYKDMKLDFDAITTGFLGSEEQVDIVIDFIRYFRREGQFVLVDPVMGDYGRIYATYTPQLCEKMKELVKYADIITPNLTELTTLLDRDYPKEGSISLEELTTMCDELSAMGPRKIVVTGIPFNRSQLLNFIYSAGHCRLVMVDRIGSDRSGTGDVISSVITGMYMNGHGLYDSVKRAADYVSKCIRYCEEHEVKNHWGLCFEMYLSDLIP